MKQRYHILDEIRGITLCSMILYHAVWDLVYIFGYNWKWYQSDMAFLWQQSICYTFILLSGFCVSLGKNKVKRGLVVFGAGILISLVTELFMPQNRIRFGVLTLLGSCMLIAALAERTNVTLWGIIINLLLFVLTRRINYGVLGFADVTVARLPRFLYNLGDFGNYLGFTEQTFFSTDYFSLFPWLFLFLTGYYFYKWMEEKQWLSSMTKAPSLGAWWRPIGRYSLIIYLLHQPVVYGLLYILA
ncbi:MAG: DUF1624 domain-containing protein [Lachnospiraceae bacterium]|nr:DUF1624 domain-containing protein [Lachnospiraceae bacterium]